MEKSPPWRGAGQVLLTRAIFKASTEMVLTQSVCNLFGLHPQEWLVDWLMRQRAPDRPCASCGLRYPTNPKRPAKSGGVAGDGVADISSMMLRWSLASFGPVIGLSQTAWVKRALTRKAIFRAVAFETLGAPESQGSNQQDQQGGKSQVCDGTGFAANVAELPENHGICAFGT
jgi:hypothetical protein